MSAPDKELGPLPAGVKLPPKKPAKKLNLPPKRDDEVFPKLDGRTVRCPYCEAPFTWPPKGLLCPACGHQLRPPHGFQPKDAEQRRALREQIAKDRDAALKRLGPRATADTGRIGIFIVLATLVVVGAMVLSALRKPKAGPKKPDDPYGQTTNLLALYSMALEHFKTDMGRYPVYKESGLLGLQKNVMNWPEWNGPYISSRGLFQDGWKHPFVYYEGTNGIPVFYSFGADGKPGTEDDLHAGPELFKCHPDFKPRDPSAKPARAESGPVSVLIGPPAK